MKRLREFLLSFLPFGLIVFIWFIFSIPYFLQHKIPYSSSHQVNNFTPWREYSEFWGPVKNNAMSDVISQMYPWKHFTIDSLKDGEIPLWNPYSFAGTPHSANYQTAVFSPFNLIFFMFPFVDAWSILILLQPLLAGLFLYLFLKSVKISTPGSLIGSVSFMFCGFITVWMAYGTMSMVAAFLPLTLFAIEKIFKKISVGSFLLLSFCIAVSFFSGHIQIVFYTVIFSFFYLVFRGLTLKNIKNFLWAIGSFTLGILISLFQILPTLELYKFSLRSELFENIGAIPLYYIVTVFAPDFFGNPVTRNIFEGQRYAEWASFVGIIPLMLALTSIVFKRNNMIIFFFFSAVFALILSLDTPLQYYLSLLKLPILSTSIPARIVLLFSFSLAVLAGFGFDRLMQLLENNKRTKVFLLIFIIGFILSVSWMSTLSPTMSAEKILTAQRNLILSSVFFFLVTTSLVLFSFTRKKLFIIGFLLFTLTAIDGFRFAQKWMPFDESGYAFPKLPVIEFMQRNIGQGRVYGNLGAQVDTYYQLSSIEGYDPLYIKRYGELIQSANTGAFTSAVRSNVVLNNQGKHTQRVLDLLGVNLIYQPSSYAKESWGYPVWKNPNNFPIIFDDGKLQIIKNTTALPRAKLFYEYEIIADKKEIINRFYSNDFDYRNVLLLEEDPNISKNTKPVNNGEAKIIFYSPNRIVISVTSSEPALLFLSDSYHPRWKVKVNGEEEKIFIANYTFRAVRVPMGQSTVEFYYSMF